MFGNDHEDKQDNNDGVQPMSTKPVNNGLLGIDDSADDNQPTTAPPAPAAPVGDDNFGDDTFGGVQGSQDSSPDSSDSDESSTSSHVDAIKADPQTSSSDDELLGIKKEALEELSPLIDHLDQNSDEKFRTTMMMIQASDNKSLIPQAYKAAKEISDDKKRAQALLDIVNEINYFTHKSKD